MKLDALIVDSLSSTRNQIRQVFDAMADIGSISACSAIDQVKKKFSSTRFDLVFVGIESWHEDHNSFFLELFKDNPKIILVYSGPWHPCEELSVYRNRCYNVIMPDQEDLGFNGVIDYLKDEISVVVEATTKDQKATVQPIKNPPVGKHEPYLNRRTDVFIIASSTGGPTALEIVFSQLEPPFNFPILIAQHMPPDFTKNLAIKLEKVSGIPAKEGQQGESIVHNKIYIAPGDFHMMISKSSDEATISLDKEKKIHSVRPAADKLFFSASELYGNTCTAMILTGMGEDGAKGAESVKDNGGFVMIQDAESATVWGMPKAAYDLGAYHRMGDLNACAEFMNSVNQNCKRLRNAS